MNTASKPTASKPTASEPGPGPRRPWLAALLLFTAAAGAAAQPGFDVIVEADREAGTIRNLFGLTCGPVGPIPGWFDLTGEYQRLRVVSVRVHDCGEIGDVHRVFPDPEANPDKASSYDFEAIDRLVLAIYRAGARPLYRLGYSWSRPHSTPVDFDRFAAIAKHIVLHYMQGWAGGHHFGDIEWEVWNEANLRASWNAGPQAFCRFYEKVARAIRAARPSARVGAHGLAVCWPADYQEGFIAFCAEHRVPLDFFSWHYWGYGLQQPEPYAFARRGRWVRALLDAHGLAATANYLTEWNIFHPAPDYALRRKLVGAAFFLSAAIFMLDGRIDLAHHYRGDICGADCMGLFVPPDLDPVPRARAFGALALMQDTPVRLATAGADRSGFAVLAGRSADRRTLQVLASDFWSGSGSRRLSIRGLAPARRRLEVHALGEQGFRLEQVRFLEPGRPVSLALPEASPWIRFLRLAAAGPGDVALVSRDTVIPAGSPSGVFHLRAPGRGGRSYVVLGSLSGSSPGTAMPGQVRLPLNVDRFTVWLAGQLEKKGYDALLGVLDPAGRADIPWAFDALDPQRTGTPITFAALVFGRTPGLQASNPITLRLR